jgi:hypothetical protein
LKTRQIFIFQFFRKVPLRFCFLLFAFVSNFAFAVATLIAKWPTPK